MIWRAMLSALSWPLHGSKALAHARTASRAAASPIDRYSARMGRLKSRRETGMIKKATASTNSTAPAPY